MANRMITAPNGNLYSTFVLGAVRHFPEKGVLITDVRGKSLDWIKVTDPVKGKMVQDMLNGAISGKIRRLDWSFLTDSTSDAAGDDIDEVEA